MRDCPFEAQAADACNNRQERCEDTTTPNADADALGAAVLRVEGGYGMKGGGGRNEKTAWSL